MKGTFSSMKITVAMAMMTVTALSIPLLPQRTATAMLSWKTTGERSETRRMIEPLANPEQASQNLSDDELAALTIYLEARGESFAGKLAVAAVIRNRMQLKYQSDGTVRGTVLRRRQFQPWNRRTPEQVPFDLDKARLRDSLLAWRLVQDGRNIVDGAVLFYNPNLVQTPDWATKTSKVAAIGRHEFYVAARREI